MDGLELVLYGENQRSPHNTLLTAFLEGFLYENKVYVLGAESKITLGSIYIEDCLGTRLFNKRKLNELIGRAPLTADPLIYNFRHE